MDRAESGDVKDMSAEERTVCVWVPELPMVLEVGGRRELLEASGVLFLFPMILLAMAVFLCTESGIYCHTKPFGSHRAQQADSQEDDTSRTGSRDGHTDDFSKSSRQSAALDKRSGS